MLVDGVALLAALAAGLWLRWRAGGNRLRRKDVVSRGRSAAQPSSPPRSLSPLPYDYSFGCIEIDL